MSMSVFWFVLALALLVLELVTTALVSIWFVPSALVTGVVSLFWDNIPAQILIFAALSGVSLWLSLRFYKKRRGRQSDEVSADERLIGRTGAVTETTSPLGGKVLVGDVYWRAESEEEIPVGIPVTVAEVRGTTLFVIPLSE